MPGPVVQWFEGHGDRLWVYGLRTAEQAAAFKAWSETSPWKHGCMATLF